MDDGSGIWQLREEFEGLEFEELEVGVIVDGGHMTDDEFHARYCRVVE